MRLNRDVSQVKRKKTEAGEAVSASVRDILADVRTKGDEAVRSYALQFDGFNGHDLFASEDEIKAAVKQVGVDFMRILARADEQITAYHTAQTEKSWGIYKDTGVIMGQILRPLHRVALYAPGGSAAYPSTVLMNAIPAKLAGVEDIIIFTPAKADGKVADAVLAAAAHCGIHKICKIGGAHAIAAAAYGTHTIPKADKIVGPGNIYVATAKRMVYGEVDIDMIAGPSEILIIADENANPTYIAADMMSQAEHDELATAVLITTSEQLIRETEHEIDRQLPGLSRKNIIQASLTHYGTAVLAENLQQAFDIANDIAPEHLEVLTQNPLEYLPFIKNAGSIFLGEHTPEPLGDYMSGTNHVLPTGGTAKFFSPLGVYDFVKRSAYSYYPKNALAGLQEDIITFAQLEGFTAHANSISVRFEG